jgi:hypothetical protein
VPANIFKATYFFEDTQSAAGWTENFYFADINIDNARNTANTATLIDARLTLMPPAYSLVAVRVTNPDTQGVSRITTYAAGAAVGLYPTPATFAVDPAEEVYDALLIRLETNAGIRRMFLLRGLPTGVVTKTSGFANPAAWQPLFNSWVVNVLSIPFVIYNRVKTGPFPTSLVLLNGDSKSLAITFPVAIPAGTTPLPGFQAPLIKLTGVNGASPVNHNWRIRSASPGTQTLTTFPGRRTVYGIPSGVTANVYVLAAGGSQINNITAIRGVKKSTGRPFNLLRGRRVTRQ